MTRSHDKLLLFMRFVEDLSGLSTCSRACVGAVIIPPDFTQIYSVGYNGQPRGLSNACNGKKGVCGCVHAEANSIVKLRADRDDLWMLTTTSPCIRCAGLIINDSRIERVVWMNKYRDESGINLLESGGITCLPFEEALRRASR